MNPELKAHHEEPTPLKPNTVVVLGLESVGKSSLLSALTGRFAESSALMGTTLRCETYPEKEWLWVDTPGIVTGSDADTVLDAIGALEEAESVLVVLRAHRAPEELADLLPLIGRRRAVVVLTFRDRLAEISDEVTQRRLQIWSSQLGVPCRLIDGRSPQSEELSKIRTALAESAPLKPCRLEALPRFSERRGKPWFTSLEKGLGFAPISLLLLFGPAWIAVTQANGFADRLYEPAGTFLNPLLDWLNRLPQPLAAMLGGDYGVAAMFPFLILYALPTILIFTGLIAIYKSSGLIDRLSYGLHPWLKPFGLGGRDLVRVIMGFGCNVPAVAATRSCSSCSRGACVSAISFGSACSYQLPATLAVFAAAGMVWLSLLYLAILAFTTLIYLRLTTPSQIRQAQNRMLMPELGHLRLPHWGSVVREVFQNLREFVVIAFPIFVGICVVAGFLEWSGALHFLSQFFAPLMAAFNLPPEAMLAVVLGSVRKDGLAIGLLNQEWDALKIPLDTPVQVLTAVYLAGVLLPCLVTVWTVAKEMRVGFAARMVARQAFFAALFSLAIAWLGALILTILS